MRASVSTPITAVAVCSALGDGMACTEDALLNGRSGLAAPALQLPFETQVGALRVTLAPLPSALEPWDTQVARLVAHLLAQVEPDLARLRARWPAHRIGVLLGTSNAGILATESAYAVLRQTGRLPPTFDFMRQHAYDGILHVVRHLSGVAGPGYVASTACSSGAKVLAAAQRWIALGLIDAAIVGGVDTLCQTTLRGFHSLGALSERACRPFCRDRDGISIGEGGALMLLERSGPAIARLLAVGESSDAHHMSAPHPDGVGAELAMRQALDLAGLRPGEVDQVNAHGTATPLNDSAEGAAIARVLGPQVPTTSTKGYTGHLLLSRD